MTGMHCDSCGGLFEYRQQIVALRKTEQGVAAGYTHEGEGGAIGETFEPVGKYHVRCYVTMSEREPEKWPELP